MSVVDGRVTHRIAIRDQDSEVDIYEVEGTKTGDLDLSDILRELVGQRVRVTVEVLD